MASGALLIFRLYENEKRKWFSKPTYEEIVKRLWQSGAPGITVFKDEEGLDARGHIQSIFSDYTYGLPITMEIYGESQNVEMLQKEISDVMSAADRTVVIPNVIDAKRKVNETRKIDEMRKTSEGDNGMTTGQMLRVYMKEEDHYHHTALYNALLRELKKLGVAWVDVQRAVEGFGEEHVIRKSHLFSFSNHAPIILEAFLEDDYERILADIRPMLNVASGPAVLIEARGISRNKSQ